MHSTLRAELRGTSNLFELLRPRSARPFTNSSQCLNLRSRSRNENSTLQQPHRNCIRSRSCIRTVRSSANAVQLGSELEQWINKLSQNGSSLKIWNTISKRDDRGNWRLLPRVRKDLEEICKRFTFDTQPRFKQFGLRIKDGKVQAIDPSNLHIEQHVDDSVVYKSKTLKLQDNQSEETQNNIDQRTPSPKQQVLEAEQAADQKQGIGGDGSPEELGNGPVTKFYGSSAARRQRSQRPKEKTTIYLLPSWFQERNVLLWEERQLRHATHTQGSIGQQKASVNDKPALASSEAPHMASEVEVLKETANDTQANQEAEKETTHAPGGNNEPDPDNQTPAGTASPPSKQSPILVALSETGRQYFIEEAQHNELLLTARGKLRAPATGSVTVKPGGIKDHLILHYTIPDGEIFLDKLVEDIAKRLKCDLITLDAQDIVTLITSSDIDPLMIDGAKTLSYDIYSELYKDAAPEDEQASRFFPDEAEDGDEDSGSSMPQGFPFVVGKPITIDLKNIFGNHLPRRTPRNTPKGIMSEMSARGDPMISQPHVFGHVVDSILSSSNDKRQKNASELGEKDDIAPDADKGKVDNVSKQATMIQVKDLKAIQDSRMGGLFLNRLYEQVEKRRAAGQTIMLVGTECTSQENNVYDNHRIRNLQDENPDHISTTMVITPANYDGSTDLSVDRARRFSIINARHLWEMLRSKNLTIGKLEHGFWTVDFIEKLHEFDQAALSKSLWSYSHVQRLAALLASDDFTESKHPIADAVSTLDLSDGSKYSWVKKYWQDVAKTAEKDSAEPTKDRLSKIREKANKHEKKLLGGVIEPKKIATTFQDIHIPPETVDALQTLTTLSLVRPDAFKYGVLSSDRIPGLLLYGPPGTGKTLAAKAVAKESGATMLEVSAADINDMYVGEGEKNVKALFSLARKLSPCVVFLDEADAMFSARSNQGRRVSHRELLNQFLREWDGMSNDSGSAFIMVATNRPMDLDDAVLRRLPRRVLVDLPTETDRLEILKIHTKTEGLADDVNLSHLASRTPFYSGSDLKNVVVAAALNAVREENEQAKNYVGDEQYQYPDKRTLTAKHFERALEEISASISEDMSSLREIKKFDEQYGDRKGRKKKAPKWGFRTASEADKVLDTVKVRS